MAHAHSALSLRDRIVTRFATEVGSERFRRYFGSQVRLTLEGRSFRVATPTAFLADWLRRRFESDLRRVASRVLGEHDGDDSVEIQFQVDAGLAERPADGSAGRPLSLAGSDGAAVERGGAGAKSIGRVPSL